MDQVQTSNSFEKNNIDIDGITFTYYKTGKGRVLFLVPAFHSDITRFTALINYLGRYFTVYIPELPGINSRMPLGHHRHTMENYGRYLTKLIAKLGFSNYILSGFCLGGPIVVHILLHGVVKPRYILLFEALYDSDDIHIEKMHSIILKIIFALGIENPLVKKLFGIMLHNSKVLKLYFRLVYRHEANIDEILKNQIRLTDEMNTRAWLELIYDIFHFHLGSFEKVFQIPALLVYNTHDDILDTNKTIVGMKKLFPHSEVLKIELARHAPAGPIDDAFVERIIQPILPYIKKLA